MTYGALLGLAGSAAIVGGVLRIVAAFVPYVPENALLELFYFVIDIALIFGLMGIYFARADRLGGLGLTGFVIAMVGQAAIVGPDGVSFGIDLYQIAAAVIALGLVVLSLQMIRTRAYPLLIPVLWIGAPVLSVSGSALGQEALGFFAAGIAYGLAFVGAGWIIASQEAH